MKQYQKLLKTIKEKGVLKSAAREGMPGTMSLFGYQMRFNLQEGFPLITTKKISFKNIVVELLWFLKGDTNIKYLVDNGCNIWNEDAYQFYTKKVNEICKMFDGEPPSNIIHEDIKKSQLRLFTFQEFVEILKNTSHEKLMHEAGYTLGDCGQQYGKLWRNWEGKVKIMGNHYDNPKNCIKRAIELLQEEGYEDNSQTLVELFDCLDSLDTEVQLVESTQIVDQFKELLFGLKNNTMSRRHIITAWNPATLDDMALNACHAFVQFNCRKLSFEQRIEWAKKNINPDLFENLYITELAESDSCPKYYLDCQMYQRSADVVLGVPYNIASYALLTEIISKVCNMIPGEFIHTFGDVHIYENHLEAVEEQLQREPRELPKLNINTEFWQTESGECGIGNLSINGFLEGLKSNDFLRCLLEEDIQLSNYNSHPKLKNETKLFTGLK